MTVRYVPPAPPTPTISQAAAAQSVVLERTYRQLPASAARILENTWVALGCAGLVLAILLTIWLWQDRQILTDSQRAWRLLAITFLAVNGLYAIIRFGLDEWIDLAHSLAQEAEIRDLLAQLDESEADNATLRTELHQAQLNLESLRRRKAPPLAEPVEAQRLPTGPTVAEPVEAQPEPRSIVCVRILLHRWQHNVSYARETMTERIDGRPQTMTETEWRSAIQLLTLAGLTGMGGPGNRQRVIVGDKDNIDAMIARVKEVL